MKNRTKNQVVRGIIAFCLFAVLPLGMQAQTEEEARWSITPHVGFNSSNMSGQDVIQIGSLSGTSELVKPKRQIGFVAGVEADYCYMKSLSTAVGIWYSREGFRYKEIDGNAHTNLDFLNFSAVENLYVADGLAIKAGLQVGCMLKAKSYLDGNSEDSGNLYKKCNLSIPVGASYEYHHMVLDVRYNIGLTNLCDIKLLNEKWRTNSLWVTLGYKFDIR